MIITPENIVHYLTDNSFITTESVVNGDFMVVDMSRRNRNFKIIRNHDNGYFVKQVKNWDMQSINTLAREANSYHLVQTSKGFEELAELMPRLIHFDSNRSIIVLELFPQSENLSEMHLRLGAFPTYIASSLGKSLGTYHKNVSKAINEVRTKKIFPETLPWMLTINHQYIQQVKNIDANHNQFFSIIDKYPEFLISIQQLRETWQVNSLIHGDMKWDNCIVFKNNETSPDKLTIKIIDWELADLGDSSWDVGAIFQTYLSLWVMSIPFSGQSGISQTEQLTKYKIEDMHPAIKAFWDEYMSTMKINNSSQNTLLQKCSQYAAIRMIQTVYEQVHFSKQLFYSGVYLLQLSLNILKNPAEATSELLGL